VRTSFPTASTHPSITEHEAEWGQQPVCSLNNSSKSSGHFKYHQV